LTDFDSKKNGSENRQRVVRKKGKLAKKEKS